MMKMPEKRSFLDKAYNARVTQWFLGNYDELWEYRESFKRIAKELGLPERTNTNAMVETIRASLPHDGLDVGATIKQAKYYERRECFADSADGMNASIIFGELITLAQANRKEGE